MLSVLRLNYTIFRHPSYRNRYLRSFCCDWIHFSYVYSLIGFLLMIFTLFFVRARSISNDRQAENENERRAAKRALRRTERNQDPLHVEQCFLLVQLFLISYKSIMYYSSNCGDPSYSENINFKHNLFREHKRLELKISYGHEKFKLKSVKNFKALQCT